MNGRMRNLRKFYNLCLDFSGKKLPDNPRNVADCFVYFVGLDHIQSQSKIKGTSTPFTKKLTRCQPGNCTHVNSHMQVNSYEIP